MMIVGMPSGNKFRHFVEASWSTLAIYNQSKETKAGLAELIA